MNFHDGASRTVSEPPAFDQSSYNAHYQHGAVATDRHQRQQHHQHQQPSLQERRDNVPPPFPQPRQVSATATSSAPAPASPRSILKGSKQRSVEERERSVAAAAMAAASRAHRVRRSPVEHQHQQQAILNHTATNGGRGKEVPPGYVVYSPDDDYSSDEENPNREVPDGGGGGEDEDDDDEPMKFGNKVLRNDSIAILRERRRNEPIHTQPTQQRAAVEVKLERRLSQRPSRNELYQRNIIHSEKSMKEQQFEERKVFLERKLSRRPTVKELRERNILIRFADYAEVIEAEGYDRRADKPWTRLRPEDKASIRKELNEFKRYEMNVHPESQYMTRFHKP